MQAFPKSLINSTKKNGTENNFASQWHSTSPNSMINSKLYVQMPFFSIFITLRLGKGHIWTVNRHFGPDRVCYTASLFVWKSVSNYQLVQSKTKQKKTTPQKTPLWKHI